MTRRHIAILALLCAGACATAAPASARIAAPAPAVVPSGPALAVRPAQLLGGTVRLRGAVARRQAGRAVLVQRLGDDGGWRRTARAVVGRDGSFLARWRAAEVGHFTLRASVAGAASRAAAVAPTAGLAVYRPLRATFYGRGFYDRATACGQTMSRTLLGVAHRTLPCGTPIEILYRGRRLTVPVVDRGPFVRGVGYDLTAATAKALGMTGTDTLGFIADTGTPPFYGTTGGVPSAP